MTYRKRRLLGRFVLTVKNFATSNVNQKQSNGECLMGMFLYSFDLLVEMTRKTYRVSYIHIGVRLSRCSFRLTGQCEGL